MKVINFHIRPLEPALLQEALTLVWEVFSEFEAPDYSAEGIQEFKSYIETDAISRRLEEGGFWIWGAFDGGKLVGVAATRTPMHITLLFVDKQYHRKGIARGLVEAAYTFHRVRGNGSAMTVNASPYGEEAYLKLGFHPTGGEQVVNGIRFIPMVRRSY